MHKITTKTASILLDKNIIKLKFNYDKGLINQIKAIPQSIWFPKIGFWGVPLLLGNCFYLKSIGFVFTPDLSNWANNEWIKRKSITEGNIPGLKHKMFPYQYKGTAFIEEKKGRALIADEMGLGKTIQSLAWLQLHPELRPVIIVCPNTPKINWQRELLKWTEETSVEILSGTTPYKITKKVVIIHYNILNAWLSTLLKTKWQVIIFDEIHYIKTAGTAKKPVLRTKAAIKLSNNIPNVIGLSGTPIENRPKELYIPLKIINPFLFPVEFTFKMKYCGPKKTAYGWNFDGSSAPEELNNVLKSQVMIRRFKRDVLPELPDKLFKDMYIELSNEQEYRLAESNFIEYVVNKLNSSIENVLLNVFGDMPEFSDLFKVNSKVKQELINTTIEKATVLAQLETLKQLAAKGIINEVIEWISEFLETEHKLIVFGIHKEILNAVYTKFKKVAVKIDGSVSLNNRQIAVDSFQNDPKIKLFVGNMEAAGVAITLTSSSNVAIIEYPWKPGILAQAIDRAHRIGQKNTVTVYKFIAANTIMEDIISTLAKKTEVINKILD